MKRLALALSCLLLACAAHAAGKADAKPSYDYAPKPGQGTVMVRVVSNRSIARDVDRWESFVAKLKGERWGKALDRVRSFEGGETLYVQSLPPGEYIATHVAASTYEVNGERIFSGPFEPEGTWTFKVEAGRMTNLGTLFYLQPQGNKREERYRWAHHPDPNLPQRSAYLFNPDDYPQLLSTQLTWSSIPADVAWSSLRPWERQLSLKLSGGTTASDGGHLFGEIMGQVAWRRADGSWAWDDTGTIETITMAADATDGARYAFAHSSQMFRKHGPNDWRRVTVPFDGAEPCYVEAQPQGALHVVWDRREKIVVMRYQPGANPEWQTMHEVATPPSTLGMLGECKAAGSGQKLVLVEDFFTAKVRLHYVNLGTKETFDLEFRNSGTFQMLPDGLIYTTHGNGIKQKLRVTRDFAKTWEQYDAKFFLKTLYRTPDEGVALRGFGLTGQDGKSTGNRSLWATSDGGRTWKPVIGLIDDTDQMFLLSGKALLFTTSAGVLYSWPGEGTSSQRERPVYR